MTSLKKRFLTKNALALIAIGLFTISLTSYGETYADEADFIFRDGEITDYSGPGGVVNIPATIGGVAVTSIGRSAFLRCSSLASVTIPESVTSIGRWAFQDCDSLTSVTIGNSVTSIEYAAFLDCSSLTSISIPDSVTNLGDAAFYGCSSLTSVSIGNSVTSIGSSAFLRCSSLSGVTIPDSVRSIGNQAFFGCASLQYVLLNCEPPSLIVSPANGPDELVFYENPKYRMFVVPEDLYKSYMEHSDWWQYKKDTIAADSVFVDNDGIIFDGEKKTLLSFSPHGETTSYTIPAKVTNIGTRAFSAVSDIQSIKVAPGNSHYVDINGVLFSSDKTKLIRYPRGRSADNYTVPSGVERIEENAFASCKNLTRVTFQSTVINPSSLKEIGNKAFYSSENITSMIIPPGVTNIGQKAFSQCKSLGEISFSDSLLSIGSATFEHCESLTNVTMPDSVTRIGEDAFKRCPSLTSVSIGNSVTSIEYGTFLDCSSLTSVSIPDSVRSIGDYAFHGCSSLSSVSIPESVTNVGGAAFQGCESLTSITIPDSVRSIGELAFYRCNSLSGFDVAGANPNYKDDSGVLLSKDGTVLIQYPAGKTDRSYTIPAGVMSIGGSAFGSCSSLTSVTIPDSVTSIGDHAFYGCDSLTSVTIDATTPPSLSWGMFNKNASGRKFYVPAGSVTTYKNHSDWSEYVDDILASGVAEAVPAQAIRRREQI